jgi:hypothetical protein
MTIATITVAIGGTSTRDFTEQVTAAETTHKSGVVAMCGTRTYSIVQSDGTTAVTSGMTVAAKSGVSGTYTITVTQPTATDSWVTSVPTYKVKAVLTRYTSITGLSSVPLTINYAACSCANTVWNAPTTLTQTVLVVATGGTATSITLSPAVVSSTTNSASSPDPGVRTCYRTYALNCETGNTKSFTALTENTSKSITFITFTSGATGNVISVLPTTSTLNGVYTLRLTQTNNYGNTPLIFTPLTLTVNCRVTSLSDLVLSDA